MLQTGRWCVILAVCWFTAGCASLPRDYPRTATTAFQNTDDTRIGRAVAPVAAQHGGQSGLCLLRAGLDAFAARLAVADAAECSLDIQYYIWHGDTTGRMLADRLIAAADRGVRVRLLLDDFGKSASDQGLLALDSHPHIEVRLFNPLALRGQRVLGTLTDFSRATRRMHNKSFTADNQVTIIGGRNIGDEYFHANPELNFADLDVLAVGPVVREASASFDLFWNSSASFPIEVLNGKPAAAGEVARRRAELESYITAHQNSPFVQALRETHLVEEIRARRISFFWGEASVVYDHPDKAAALSDDTLHRLLPKLRPTIDATQHELLVVSPYLVPGKEGVAFLRALRKRGVRVVILTNSLASTDGVEVHAGYSRYRKDLLREGVELYELKPTAKLPDPVSAEKSPRAKPVGSSHASLHAKTFALDRTTLFVGSLNLDPRSARLNTEVGVVFHSAALTAPVVENLEARLGEIAWRVEAVPVGADCRHRLRLIWVTEENGQPVRVQSEPAAGFWRKFKVMLIGLLPIESQL